MASLLFRRGAVLLGIAPALASCAQPVVRSARLAELPRLASLSLRADSTGADTLLPGAVHYTFVIRRAPWVIHVLDLDRAVCWSLRSVKAGHQAVGRAPAWTLVAGAARDLLPGAVVGGVNADFFSFTPPGVPAGASIHQGRVITGPSARPVLAIDSMGRPWIGSLRVTGRAIAGSDTFAIEAWNRPSPAGLALFDAGFGPAVDTAAGSLRLTLRFREDSTVASVDSSGGAVPIPSAGAVLSLGADAPPSPRHRLGEAASPGTRLRVELGLEPFQPLEAVGGFPVLLRDSLELAGLEQAGGSNFGPVRHPRTIVGVGSGGRRLLLVTVDGRQAGYSVGMTLRESAQLLRDLGATEALNLDGGGSTTLVIRDRPPDGNRFRVVNRPSDRGGERPVANALVAVSACP